MNHEMEEIEKIMFHKINWIVIDNHLVDFKVAFLNRFHNFDFNIMFYKIGSSSIFSKITVFVISFLTST